MLQNKLKRLLYGNSWQKIIVLSLTIALGVKGLLVLCGFNFLVSDNDQAIQWLACHDFSNLHFNTPFLYGCNYGSCLEPFLAVPFYKLGVPIYYVLPFTVFFFIYVLILSVSFQLSTSNKPVVAIGMLLFLMILPLQFWALVFSAKGHLAGILLCIISVVFFA